MDRLRLQAWVLRLVGSVEFLAFGAVVMPRAWMESGQAALGFPETPGGPVFESVMRQVSFAYGLHGVGLWLIASDVVRYLPFVVLTALGYLLAGPAFILIDSGGHAVVLDGRQRRVVSAHRAAAVRPARRPAPFGEENVMAFQSLRQSFRTSARKVALFCEGRDAQPDEEFVAACGLPAGPEGTRVALAVRRAVANIGSVDPGFIRPSDVYPDQLGVLPFWDSIDWLAFLFELEKELGTKISSEEMEQPFINPERASVREWAAGVYRMLAARGGLT